MSIQTEPIGSIPRPPELVQAVGDFHAGRIDTAALEAVQRLALTDTIARFEATGSPVISDGEQTKPSFVSYPLAGLENLAPDGAVIPFADAHTRQLPRLTSGPFHYATHAGAYFSAARGLTARPLKQAVISASAISLIYPQQGVPGYAREEFLADLIDEVEADIRGPLEAGASVVQIDFTEARLSLKLDPSGGLLRSFIALNNQVLDRFPAEDRKRIGVHVCPGGDQDSTHSADIDYALLLPDLFQLNAGRFYLQLASEAEPDRVLKAVSASAGKDQMIFVGVIDPIDARLETPELVRDRVLASARVIQLDRLGTTDDCGFAPFADDTSTARELAFSKIAARVEGTALAAKELGV